MYSSRLGRWSATDPLQVFYAGGSGYHYAFDNPVWNLDVDGKFVIQGTQAEQDRLRLFVAAAKSSLETNPFLLQKFKEHSGLTDDEIDIIFTEGKGPALSISKHLPSDKYARLYHRPGADPELMFQGRASDDTWTIALNSYFTGSDYDGTGAPKFQFFSTMAILHELVHLGDEKDGVSGNTIDFGKLRPWKLQQMKDESNNYPKSELNSFNVEVGKAFEVDVSTIGLSANPNVLDNAFRSHTQMSKKNNRANKNSGGSSGSGKSGGGGKSKPSGGHNTVRYL